MTTGIPEYLSVRDLPSESQLLSIPYPEDKVFVDYFAPNNTKLDIQMKTRILDFEPKDVKDVPIWDISMFDTYENVDPRPELTMKPVAMFPCPFRKGKNKIVLCEFYDKERVPLINKRNPFVKFMEQPHIVSEEGWFGFEQEYWITDLDGLPLGWQLNPEFVHDTRFASLDTGKFSGLERQLVDYHARACLYAGLNLFGTAREESVAQWEYQLGPSPGIEVCDQLIVSRYLLKRAAEIFGLHVSFLGKPAPFTVWASGIHINYSTKKMRAEGGIEHIQKAVDKLAITPHANLFKYYDRHGGEDNKIRLIGDHFIPSYNEFSSGMADKYVSVRIPVRCAEQGRGYLEERRPISDCDPYEATLAFMKAIYTDELL